MDSKHYVSLEAARLLKELGYNDSANKCYDSRGYLFTSIFNTNEEFDMYKNVIGENYSAPTLLEAMDWLDSKGIHMEIRMMHCKVKGDPYKIADDDEYQWKWYFATCNGNDVKHPVVECDENDYVIMHTDRNECMQRAIEKALDLL